MIDTAIRPDHLEQLTTPDDSPVCLARVLGSTAFGRADVPLVEIFTAAEQRARTSQAYSRSAVGSRLRHVETTEETDAEGDTITVTQRDDATGLVVRTTIGRPSTARALRIVSTITNTSDRDVVITAVTSATIGLGHTEDDLDTLELSLADSEWLAENRWRTVPLRSVVPRLGLDIHGQDGRGHYSLASHGAWSTGEHLPAGVIGSPQTGEHLAWQIESSGAWVWDVAQARSGGVLSLLGPADLEHQFAHRLTPGSSFETVPVALAVSDDGLDGAIAELTRYRRSTRRPRAVDRALPVVYNDFMNTLMGQPSTEALLPLIDAAADAGVEYFCIDAGWFADPAIGDWWSTVGAWNVAESRFSGGFSAVVERIRARGMRPGIWLEPEVVGVDGEHADAFPADAYFTRFGERVVEDRRVHLDLRHPAVRQHLDSTVDRLVGEFGIAFFKLDYNINPGPGTEVDATSAGDGLLAHTRALHSWIAGVSERHPDVLIENCSSGAMRADHALVSATHLQSTSDQQNFELYPPIAASAPATIPPEQCGNWAYPARTMNGEETAFTLVTGLSGRLYLSGFLHELDEDQRALVAEAVGFYRSMRGALDASEPFWPLGLPGWDDDLVCLGLRSPVATHLFIWDRSAESREITIDGLEGHAESVFPAAAEAWEHVETDGTTQSWRTPAGLTARVFRIDREGAR